MKVLREQIADELNLSMESQATELTRETISADERNKPHYDVET